MDSVNTPSNKLPIKDTGLMGKNQAKEKSSLKVVVYFKAHLKMILKTVMGKCIIIHLGTILRVNGETIRKKVMEP